MRDALKRTLRSLRSYNYRLYFFGQVVSVSGTWMQTFAQGWLVLQISRSNSLDLGFVTAAQFIPMLLLLPLGGAVADRFRRRNILYFTQSAALLQAVGLGAVVLAHKASVPLVAGFAVLLGLTNVFDNPARQAFVQEMVGREDLPNAVALNSVIMNAARIIGPGIGGLVVGAFGVAPCFFINAVSYAFVIAALLLMRSGELYRVKRARERSSVVAGLRYVASEPGLFVPLLMMVLVGTLSYNFQVSLLLLAKHTFLLNSSASGALFSAMGAGSVIGGLIAAYRKRPTDLVIVVASALFGLFMAGVALAPSYEAALILLIPTGLFSIVYLSSSNATLQLRSRSDMRGRVMSLYALAFLGTTPIGSLAVSAVASAFGARMGIGIGAIAALAAALMGFSLLVVRRTGKEVGPEVPVEALSAEEVRV